MLGEIIRNPKTIKGLADELIKVCDGYWSRQITEEEGKGYIVYWAKHEGKKLFKGKEINSTITKIIGKRRVELVSKWIEGTQIEL